MRLNKKLLIGILLFGIVVVISITAMHLHRYFASDFKTIDLSLIPSKNVGIFDAPDFIEIRCGMKKVTLTVNDEEFTEILELNRSRGKQQSNYYASEDTLGYGVDSEVLVLTYGYRKAVDFCIPLRTETTTVSAQNLSFLLTGDYSDTFLLNEQPYIFYSTLNVSAELNAFLNNLLKEQGTAIHFEKSFFPMPTEILLQNINKTVSILPDEEGFDELLAVNDQRFIASFYNSVDQFKTYVTEEDYNGLKMILRYENAPVKVIIPGKNRKKVVLADQIIVILTAEESDKFIIEKDGAYTCYTGLAESPASLKLGFYYLNSKQ